MKKKKLSFRSSQDLNLGFLYTGGGKSEIWGAHDYKYMVARGVRGHAQMRPGDKTIQVPATFPGLLFLSPCKC